MDTTPDTFVRRLHEGVALDTPTVDYDMGAPEIARDHEDACGVISLRTVVDREAIRHVVPEARHRAFMLLSERGVDGSNMAIRPRVRTLAEYQDPNTGDDAVMIAIRFEMSDMLNAAVHWDDDNAGYLPAIWEIS